MLGVTTFQRNEQKSGILEICCGPVGALQEEQVSGDQQEASPQRGAKTNPPTTVVSGVPGGSVPHHPAAREGLHCGHCRPRLAPSFSDPMTDGALDKGLAVGLEVVGLCCLL